MSNAHLNRFEWLKFVMQTVDLTPATRLVASALAVQFANDETGQINPSRSTVASYLGLHPDTVKKHLRELYELGWLDRSVARGRGKSNWYHLRLPANVVAYSSYKKRGTASLSNEGKRGMKNVPKRGQNIPPHKKQEQSKEQVTSRPAPQCQKSISIGSPNENAWNAWLERQSLPGLEQLGLYGTGNPGTTWDVPFRYPPEDDDIVGTNIAIKWAIWACGETPNNAAELAPYSSGN
jgi:DNA-binding transcriptional ArsR family regulator